MHNPFNELCNLYYEYERRILKEPLHFRTKVSLLIMTSLRIDVSRSKIFIEKKNIEIVPCSWPSSFHFITVTFISPFYHLAEGILREITRLLLNMNHNWLKYRIKITGCLKVSGIFFMIAKLF